MKNLILSCSLSIIVSWASAQITFQKTYGGADADSPYSVQQTTDGGYIISGQTISFVGGNYDIYLIKTDANGDTLWTKTIGGVGLDQGVSVKQTSDGGYVIGGITNSFGAGFTDVYLCKTDSNGNLLWKKTFGGTSEDRGYSVQQTTDGGYIVSAFSSSFGVGNSDIYLIKTDSNGDSLWTKILGDTGSETGNSIQQTTEGGFIITGSTNSFGAGLQDVYLVKTDTIGNILWSKTFGGANEDAGLFVRQTSDGGYIVTGNTQSFGAGNVDVYLIKTNIIGDTLWTKTFGGTEQDWAYDVQQTTDGGYIIAGRTYSFGTGNYDVYLIKTDANGDLLWTRTFGGTSTDDGRSIQQTMDGGYIIAGWSSSFGTGNYDVYLIKTDSSGSSGCNEGSTITIESTSATQVLNPTTTSTSPATITTDPTTLVGSGGVVMLLCTSVGIDEIVLDNSFIIYPNPTTGNFIITFDEAIRNGTVEIFNIVGENVFMEVISNESKKDVKLNNILSGIYFVKVWDGEKSYCKKLILNGIVSTHILK